MLTPSDIEQKTFSTALRGYDLDEVDDFLDEVVSSIRDLQEELAEARSSAAKSPEPVADESAVGRALIAAQSAADQILAAARDDADRALANAKEEADRLITEAQEQAEEFVAERDSKKAQAEAEMQALSEHVSNIRTQLALLATAVADKLDEMDALVAGEVAESGQAYGTGGDEDAEATVAASGDVGEGEEPAEDSLFDEDEPDEEEGEDADEEEDEEDEDSLP
ncbi:MAG: DivIVA domain-containing protein [Actinobacteria bacterium]|nr:DivIVA domain-containing protein [Actinomycetota bacterium]